MEPSTRAQTPSPSPAGGHRDPYLGKGNQTCELEDLVINVGHGLVVHDLASEDKLQATFSHKLADLGVVGREKRQVTPPRLNRFCLLVSCLLHLPVLASNSSASFLLQISGHCLSWSALYLALRTAPGHGWCFIRHAYRYTTFVLK